MKETWRPVKRFEGYYEISNYGKVKSVSRSHINSKGVLRTLKERPLKGTVTKKGYLQYCLRKDGSEISIFAHRMVAEAFVSGDHSLTVNHIDGNKLNNHFANLEWITGSDNAKHAWQTGLCESVLKSIKKRLPEMRKKSIKASSIPVLKYKDGIKIKEYENMRRAAEDLGVDFRNMNRAIKSGRPYHGYVFQQIRK